MPNPKKLVFLYGEVGARIKLKYEDCGIATNNSDEVFHIHFRANREVDDSALKLCRELPALTELVLNETSITDAGLAHLSQLQKLAILHLAGTAITDEGLNHIVGLPLRTVDLCRTFTTDRGLEKLRSIISLQDLWLIDTHVSPFGLNAFRKHLPDCRIHVGE